jgi:hypothetical protein
MALTPQTTQTHPNAVYIPQLVLTTRIVGGELKTKAIITLAGATLDESTWSEAVGQKQIVLDIDNLPQDIIAAGPAILSAYTSIIEAVGIINGVRKYL